MFGTHARVIFGLVAFCCSACFARADALAGDWAGGIEFGGAWSPFLIHLQAHDASFSGTADALVFQMMGQPLQAVAFKSGQLHFELPLQGQPISFDGAEQQGAIIGKMTLGGKTGAFRLDRTLRTNVERFAGCYEFAPDHYIALSKLPMELGGIRLLTSLDYKTGQVFPLFPGSASTFFSGPAFEAKPADTRVAFTTDTTGQLTVTWTAANSGPLTGKPVVFEEQQVTFANGDVRLAGTLLLPRTPGPHPAVVFAHGSGPDSRQNPFYRMLGNFYAANGVAALIYDKRGVGESSGNWAAAGFDDFAGDTLAGLELLKHRKDIDPKKIGLCGMSQGGWIIALAASRSADVAFIISLSGAGVSPEAQGAYMVEHRVRAEGFSDAEVAQALALYRLNSQCARTGTDWEECDAAIKAAKQQRWFHPEYAPQNPKVQQQWRAICDFDPVSVLQKVHCPVLAMLGGMDPLVPGEQSAKIWKETLTQGGNKDVTIQLLPYADHGLADPRIGAPRPEFLTLQREWLAKRFH